MGSAVQWVSGLPAEIWNLVAELIYSRETFLQLIQVCRAFSTIFVPFLHRQHSIRLNQKRADAWLSWPIPQFLEHVRDFEVHVHEFVEHRVEYKIGMNKTYAKFLVNILPKMPNLQSFRWNDDSFDDNFGPALILRNKPLLQELKHCRTLKHLSIQFTHRLIGDGPGADKCWTKLQGFQNLTSLELYNFFGDEDKLIRDIAMLLSDSPRLKKLGLGMAHDANCDGVPEMIITNGNYEFLEKLCKRYASHEGATPLPLETLRLGYGMYLGPSKSPATGNYLRMLVQLDQLKTLHLFNSLLLDDEDSDVVKTPTEWSFFGDCKSIHQLSVSRITSDVTSWLCQGGSSVQELFVTDHYGMHHPQLDNFCFLALPKLSMLFVREVYVVDNAEEDEWEDTDSSVSSMYGYEGEDNMVVDAELSDVESSDSESSDSESSDSEQSDVEHLDALISTRPSVKMDHSVITVLDRMLDGGSQLTRLALCIIFESQWALFATHLPNLKHLTQLRLDPKSARGGRFPTPRSSLWPGVDKDKDIAKRYVQLAKSLCPSLQYVQVRDWAWQITVPHAVRTRGDIYSKIELRELDFDERVSIELFAVDTFTYQSGLLGIDEYHEEMSEEERHRTDLQIEEVEAALREGRPIRRLFTGGPDIPLEEVL